MHVIVRNVGHVGRVGACMLYPCGSEQREHGVGAGVNATMLSETLPFTSLVGCRYNERLNAKTEGSKLLVYTGLLG